MNSMPRINNIPPRPFVPIEFGKQSQKTQGIESGASFKDVLMNQIQSTESVKFSKHALDRLQSRNINLSDEQIMRLERSVDLAESKGSKESLMLMDDVAMVVSVDNRTVVTCMDTGAMRDHIFTNIDSAAVV